jgi:hypothetical protein
VKASPHKGSDVPKPVVSIPYTKSTTSWFKDLTGCLEDTSPGGYKRTQSRFVVEGDKLRSLENDQTYGIGHLELLSLQELRNRARSGARIEGIHEIRVVQGDAGQLHGLSQNQGALFQVASQFNMLEMPGASVTPERGVTGYASDNTQGPSCALAAGAATIYRNYFASVNGQVGQTKNRQLDGFAILGSEIAHRLGQPPRDLWSMCNGYAMFEPGAVDLISRYLVDLNAQDIDYLRQLLRIGVQWNVQVTSSGVSADQLITQAFCSALPIGYHSVDEKDLASWEPLARLILDALYEATLWAAVINAQNGGSTAVLLTFVGGGVFKNKMSWIRGAIERAVRLTSAHALDIAIVLRYPATADELAWVDGLKRLEPVADKSRSKPGPEGRYSPEEGADTAREEQPSAAELRSQLLELSRYPSDWRTVLGQLVNSVGYCEQAGSAAWSVTLRGARYRLNVGNIEAMTTTFTTWDAESFGSERGQSFADVRVLISGPDAPELAQRVKDRCGVVAERYKSVGEPHWSVRVTFVLGDPPSDPSRVQALKDLRDLQVAHRYFVEKATRTSTGKIRQKSNYSRTHMPSLYECAMAFMESSTRFHPYHDLLWDEDLLPEHIPSFDADWSEVSAFALTFDGEGEREWRPDGQLDEALDVAIEAGDISMSGLRTWLYSAQRGWRGGSYDGSPPGPEQMQKIRLVLDLIRRRVSGKTLGSNNPT